jgi:copper chaperone
MTRIKIEGMTCHHCVTAVTVALEGVPGVARVIEVDLDHGEALVDGTSDPAALVAAVEREGYRAEVLP